MSEQQLIGLLQDGIQDKIDSLNDARDNANAAAATITTTNKHKITYVDPVNGNDANDGSTKALAIKSWGKMIDSAERGVENTFRILNDINADEYKSVNSPAELYRFQGWDGATDSATQRKIIFKDAVNVATYAGGIYFYGSTNIQVRNVDLKMNYNASRNAIYGVYGHLVTNIYNSTITRTGTGASLFRSDGTAHWHVGLLTVDAGASGHVIHNVASGGDPNAINGYSANFTSA